MDVTFAVIASHANPSPGMDAVDIFGVTTGFAFRRFPSIIGDLMVVVEFTAGVVEFGTLRILEVVLLDEDGKELDRKEQVIESVPSEKAGRRSIFSVPFRFSNIKIDKPGDYQFSVLINNDEKRSIPLYVDLM